MNVQKPNLMTIALVAVKTLQSEPKASSSFWRKRKVRSLKSLGFILINVFTKLLKALEQASKWSLN